MIQLKGRLIGLFIVSLVIIMVGCSAGAGESGATDQAIGVFEMNASSADEAVESGSRGAVARDSSYAEEARAVAEAAVPPGMDGGEMAQMADQMERKVIRERHLELDVPDLDKTVSRIRGLIEETDGAFIESMEQWKEERSPQRTEHHALAILRVPLTGADQLVSAIEAEGNVLRRHYHGQDVTEEYIDNEARLRNLYQHEERLLELYERAENVEELLQLEAEVARIREQIELIEGRQQYFDRVTTSLRLQLHLRQVEEKEYLGRQETEPIIGEAWAGFKQSLHDIWFLVRRAFVFLISSLPYFVMIAVIAVPVSWFFIRLRKGRAKGED